MEIIRSPKAEKDLKFYVKSDNKAVLKRIAKLTEAIVQNPHKGIGKPEPLKHQLAGKWSRRIDRENRLIYAVESQMLFIYSLRGLY